MAEHQQGHKDPAHPDFDGHLEVPFEQMSSAQRLHWLWQVIAFRAAAQAPNTNADTAADRLDAAQSDDV